MTAHDWQARFVGRSTPSSAGDPALYVRHTFSLRDDVLNATLHVTALGIVEQSLNGAKVGNELLAPGWTAYRHRVGVSSYAVTSSLQPGENVLGAVVGEGWAAGLLRYEGIRHNYIDRPAVFLQLEVEYADRTETIVSGEASRCSTGAVKAHGLYEGEEYDARLEPTGWDQPGFDDGAWQSAVVIEWDLATLRADIAPRIRAMEEIEPVAITTTPAGRTVVDFGVNLVGWVRIRVSGDRGATVVLRHAETLTPGGEPEYESNRGAAATDRYTMRGGEVPETWEPRFTFHGFRYVDVEGWPGTLSAEDIRAIVVHSDKARSGWFETSNDLVTKFEGNVVRSMRGNFVGVPTDCPQPDERMGWTGDLNAFAPSAAFLYDVRGVLRSWLEDLAAEQTEKGFVPWVVPDILTHPSAPTALWSDVAISLPWVLYNEYGDLEILRRSYPSMVAFMTQVEPLLDEDGLWSKGYQFGDWLDPDAPPENAAAGKTDKHLVASAYLCKTTRELAATAGLLGEEDDAAHFSALAERVRAAFRHQYVTPAGRVTNESSTAYALAIVFEILQGEQRRKAGDRLAELVAQSGYRISTGFAGTPHVADALTSTGHVQEAYLLLLEEGCPSFLSPVTMGATTIWERWDSVLPDGTLNSTGMTSLNHYALGSVADWLHRVVGGLERIEPGWQRIKIAPIPGGNLTSARVAHHPVLGRAEVGWQLESGHMELNVVIPEGATATVVLPLHPDNLVEKVGPGGHSWRYATTQDARRTYGLDTPLAVLVENRRAWQEVLKVFATHLPGISIDSNVPEAAAMTLDMIMVHLPVQLMTAGPEALRRDLEATLERLSN